MSSEFEIYCDGSCFLFRVVMLHDVVFNKISNVALCPVLTADLGTSIKLDHAVVMIFLGLHGGPARPVAVYLGR